MPVFTDKSAPAPTKIWLHLVGVGEDGVCGLGEAARAAIAAADHVFGGARHLALAASLINGDQYPWPQPFDRKMADVVALRGRAVCVLASGDPFHFGVGRTLARVIDPAEMAVYPAPSCLSIAAARLGWSLPDTDIVSLLAASVGNLRPYLRPGRRILALTTGSESPAEIAALMTQQGFGNSGLTLLEALGGPRERISHHIAHSFDTANVDPLNLVAISVMADSADAKPIPLTSGLPDHWFDHDGQLTKREIRALTLSALGPQPGERLWDIGAGAGSIAIEWLLAHSSMQAIAVERDSRRATRIRQNAANLGTPSLEVVEGTAPAAFADLAAPDAIFVGGGGSDELMLAAIDALSRGGRLVANVVTLDMEALLARLAKEFGGELIRLSLARAEPLGSKTGWRPAMPVTQWSWRKP